MPDFSQLTQRQQEIYEFIRDKIETRGYGPTGAEIGDEFDIESPNGVMCHLKALEKKGLIIRTGFQARAIQLVDQQRPAGSGIASWLRRRRLAQPSRSKPTKAWKSANFSATPTISPSRCAANR